MGLCLGFVIIVRQCLNLKRSVRRVHPIRGVMKQQISLISGACKAWFNNSQSTGPLSDAQCIIRLTDCFAIMTFDVW